jgi:hypothetical protein
MLRHARRWHFICIFDHVRVAEWDTSRRGQRRRLTSKVMSVTKAVRLRVPNGMTTQIPMPQTVTANEPILSISEFPLMLPLE